MKEFSPYRLDPVNLTLWRTSVEGRDEQIVLAPRAFDLLRLLVDNPGRLITHDELLDSLWPGVHVQPEVIKGQIRILRQTLGDDAKSPRFIETVRGRGYRFVAQVGSDIDHLAEGPARRRPALIGRAEPLADLREKLREAEAGALQLVFVAGEPGIGKTALIDEFIEQSSNDRPLYVTRGQCVEGFGGAEPYYPVLEAIGRLCKSPAGDVVTQHLVSLAPTWAMQLPAYIPLDRWNLPARDIAGAGRERMLREICDFVEGVSLARPVLLVLEDLHWADYSTIDLLSVLARRRSRARLMIVGSYRSGLGHHPVTQVCHALALQKLCSEIRLEPLSETAITDFLANVGQGRSVPPAFASWVRTRSGGNPLFMTATLDHLAERGFIEPADETWRVRVSLDEVGTPVTLTQVIEAQIRRLTEEQRTVLQAASVAGVSFAPIVAASATDYPPERFEDICEELCRQEDFIRREEAMNFNTDVFTRTYSFRHALYRQVFYDRQGPIRLVGAHRKIGERLEASYPIERRGEIASELVQHFGAAEEWARVLTYLRTSMQTAKQRFANHEAMEILDRATLLVDRLPRGERGSAEMALLEARAAIYMVEHHPRAEENYRRFAELAAQHGDLDAEARALLGLGYCVAWRDQALGLRVLDQAIEVSKRQTDELAQARTLVSAHAWKIWIGGWNEADAHKCESALGQLRNGMDVVAAAWASLEFCLVLVLSTRYREGQVAVKASYQQLHLSAGARPEFSLERAVWSYFLGLPFSSMLLGELGRSLHEFDEGIALFSKSGNSYAVVTLRLYRAWLFLHCRDYSGVIDEVGQVIGEGSDNGTSALLPAEHRLAILLLGLAKVGLGAIAEAHSLLAEVARRMDAQPVVFDWYWRMSLERGLTFASIAVGELSDARAHADELVKLAVSTEDRTWQGLAFETRAAVALQESDCEAATKFVTQALDATAGFTTPLADWRILAAGAAAYLALGDHQTAEAHAAASDKKRTELIASLPDGCRLRASLASAPEFGAATERTVSPSTSR
jgi:DNA-binding winged helix-turn-helix (wHTH) protein